MENLEKNGKTSGNPDSCKISDSDSTYRDKRCLAKIRSKAITLKGSNSKQAGFVTKDELSLLHIFKFLLSTNQKLSKRKH